VVERCQGSGCAAMTTVATPAADVTSWTDTGLVRNTSYTYRVRATNTAGPSGYAGPLSARTLR
jgi:hypothetical protein